MQYYGLEKYAVFKRWYYTPKKWCVRVPGMVYYRMFHTWEEAIEWTVQQIDSSRGTR